jgi:hypothetical protein
MKNILLVQSSPRGSESYSQHVADSIVKEVADHHLSTIVTFRDLARDARQALGKSKSWRLPRRLRRNTGARAARFRLIWSISVHSRFEELDLDRLAHHMEKTNANSAQKVEARRWRHGQVESRVGAAAFFWRNYENGNSERFSPAAAASVATDEPVPFTHRGDQGYRSGHKLYPVGRMRPSEGSGKSGDLFNVQSEIRAHLAKSKKRLPEYVSHKPANLRLRSQYSINRHLCRDPGEQFGRCRHRSCVSSNVGNRNCWF